MVNAENLFPALTPVQSEGEAADNAHLSLRSDNCSLLLLLRLLHLCPYKRRLRAYACNSSVTAGQDGLGPRSQNSVNAWPRACNFRTGGLTMNLALSDSCCATCLASTAPVYSLLKVRLVMDTSSSSRLKYFARAVSNVRMSRLTTCSHAIYPLEPPHCMTCTLQEARLLQAICTGRAA